MNGSFSDKKCQITTVSLPYGKDKRIEFTVPQHNLAGTIYPKSISEGDERGILMRAVSEPLGNRTIDDFLKDKKSLLVVVNDATRPTPSAKMLDAIYNKLSGRNVTYISAVGSHRPPTDEEHRMMFGIHYDKIRDRIAVHDCRDEINTAHFGVSRFGTEIKMNPHVAKADGIIIINSVEPHYFAGYTGGRKSLFPGLATYSSISQNHRLAMDAGARTFALEGNPVHEDMDDIVSKIGKDIYSVQCVLDAHHRIFAAFAGDYRDTFNAAVEAANRVFTVEIDKPVDIVVTVAPYPTDIDLYQAQKSLDNGKNIVKKGGIIILVAECREGIGNETFYRLLSSADTPEKVFNEIKKGYKLGYHKAAKMAEIMLNASVFAVSSFHPDVLGKIFIRGFPEIQKAVDRALAEQGADAEIIVLMDGNLTVPRIKSG